MDSGDPDRVEGLCAAAWCRLVTTDRCNQRKFKDNLRPYPPTLQDRVDSIHASLAWSDETCVRGEETRIANQ